MALALPVAAANAAAPAVSTTVVGRGGRVLAAPAAIRTTAGSVAVAGAGTCPALEATPLAALLATGLPVRVTGSSCADDQLYVAAVSGQAAAGADGWVYKVGRRAGTAGAGAASGPFGAGRLRASDDLLWFWCASGARGCERTLSVARSGSRFRVLGSDDDGHGVRVRGARVTARSRATGKRRSGITNRRGEVVLRGLDASDGLVVGATRRGMVPAVAA